MERSDEITIARPVLFSICRRKRYNKSIMRLILLALFLALLAGCEGEESKKEPSAPKKEEKQPTAEPVDLGDPNAPVMIRALQGAKEVKKQTDARREEDKEVLKERD